MIHLALALALACAGCLEDHLIACGELLCARDASCVAGKCIDPAAVAACQGVPDGGPCSTPSLSAGVCGAGVCTTPGCSNGFVDSGEVCDDGNNIDGDGCSADCAVRDTCPPLGTAPHYGVAIHLAVQQICESYSVAGDEAFGGCFGTSGGRAASTGLVDQPLTPIPGLGTTSSTSVLAVRIAPEGDTLYVQFFDNATYLAWVTVYTRQGGTWTERDRLVFPTQMDYLMQMSPPTRGPARRMIVWVPGLSSSHEYAIDANDVATDLGKVTVPGLTFEPQGIHLSPDGLRILGYGPNENNQYAEFYSDRPTVDDPFGAAQQIVGVPLYPVAFMTETCDRVYFQGFDAVYYVTQD